jgi:ubiquitin carboxyl-terminal hydrolase 1
MASLISHLERIVALAVDVDIPTPVTDALLDVLQGPF